MEGSDSRFPIGRRLPGPDFSAELAGTVVRVKIERRPGTRKTYKVWLGRRVLMERSHSPVADATRLVFLHGFSYGTLEIERAGAALTTIDMQTAMTRAAAKKVIVGRPRLVRQKR